MAFQRLNTPESRERLIKLLQYWKRQSQNQPRVSNELTIQAKQMPIICCEDKFTNSISKVMLLKASLPKDWRRQSHAKDYLNYDNTENANHEINQEFQA